MLGKQVEPTENIKRWVKFFNDQSKVDKLSRVLGARPLTIFSVPFFDCHWFDFENIETQIREEVSNHKHHCLTNINSTFYIPYQHNLFLTRGALSHHFCSHVFPTAEGLNFEIIRCDLDAYGNLEPYGYYSTTVSVDDVEQDLVKQLKTGRKLNGEDIYSNGVKIIGGALDYTRAYCLHTKSFLSGHVDDWKFLRSESQQKMFRKLFTDDVYSLSAFVFLVLGNGKYTSFHFIRNRDKFNQNFNTALPFLRNGSALTEESEARLKSTWMEMAHDFCMSFFPIINDIYHGLNLIHKHDTQVPVLTTTKDSVFKSKRRNKKGVKPLIEWRTYEYDISKPVFKLNKHTGYRGTHASPREHERRGHLRVMKKSGRQVWVNPCKVGDKALGEIHKNFVVTSNNPIGQSKEV